MTRFATSDALASGRPAGCTARLFLVSLLLPSLSMTVARTARADDVTAPDPVAAALFQSGRELIDKGDWGGGCAKLAQSLARYPNASTQLNLARCREHEGKLASAWAMYQRASVLNRETPGERRREELEKIAQDGVTRLEARLPRLQVRVRSATADPLGADLRVVEGGRDLPIGEPVPLDPGTYEVVATSTKFAPARQTVLLVEGGRVEVDLVLQPEKVRTAPVPSAAPPASSPRPQAPIESAHVPAWAWVAGGLGIVASGFAVGFAMDAKATADSLREACGEELVCDPDGSVDVDAENAQKNRSVGLALGLGAVSVAGLTLGIIGIATASGSSVSAAAVSLPGGGGARILGRF